MAQKHDLFSYSLPQTLWRAEVVKSQEAVIADKLGISLSLLMERAGQAAFEYLQSAWPGAQKLLVLAGGGNNGGDAYVVARLAKQSGQQVQVIDLGSTTGKPSEAGAAKDAWVAAGGKLETLDELDWQCDVIVDGVLGTGITGSLRQPLCDLFAKVNLATAPVLSLDLPSGLCANTGRNLGAVISANATITFIAAKQGLFTGHAAEYVGELVFAGLGIDQQFEKYNVSDVSRVEVSELTQMLQRRSKTAHKGQFGRLAMVGGNKGMPGAIRMAAEASLRTGAGLVNVFTHSENSPVVSAGRPELMVAGIGLEHTKLLAESLKPARCVVIGPGLGQDQWAKLLLTETFTQTVHCLVDADGLNLLALAPLRRNDWVLTPHPGEAARLLACSVADIEGDRIAAARHIQQAFGGVCVLKGAGTIIAGNDGKVKICNVGNPGMASGGMGDVLSGIIGGLMAQFAVQHSLFDIACLGVSIHGMAGDLAAAQGERGMLASDLMPYIRQLVNPEL
ncbi:NAD(P)H-hydrate dehydratase [Agarivorans sp. 1_MG-2023]|nr:NAD(P)H-hydrate dehydratase [Agarivorans sp. 1_MG-2023]MDO6766062.1 NAD(P)H-hydrate dehydratase [Agarivorans sp. 1_MG-2023]